MRVFSKAGRLRGVPTWRADSERWGRGGFFLFVSFQRLGSAMTGPLPLTAFSKGYRRLSRETATPRSPPIQADITQPTTSAKAAVTTVPEVPDDVIYPEAAPLAH